MRVRSIGLPTPRRSGNPLREAGVIRVADRGSVLRLGGERIFTHDDQREAVMLWTVAVLLVVLWALGLVTSYSMGGLIHILLVLAVIAVAIRLIQGRRVL